MKKISLEKIFAGILLALPVSMAFAQERWMFMGAPWYVPEVLVLIAGGLFFVLAKRSDWRGCIWSFFSIAIALLIVGALVSAVVNDMTPHGYGRIKSWLIFPALYGALVYFSIRKDWISVRSLLLSLFAGSVILGLMTVGMTIEGTAFSYDHRLHGQFFSANHLAMMLAPGVIAGILLAWPRAKRFDRPTLLFCSGAAFLFVLVLLSQSYTVIIALLLSFSLALFLMRDCIGRSAAKWMLLAALVSVAWGISLNTDKLQSLASFDDRSSFASRIIIWESALRIIGDNPFAGIGSGNFQKEYLEYQRYFPPYLEWAAPHPHNMFLDVWIEAGILGLSGLSLLMASWIFSAWMCLKNIKNEATIIMMTPLLFGIYFLLVGLVDVPFLLNGMAYSFALAAALARGISDRSFHLDD